MNGINVAVVAMEWPPGPVISTSKTAALAAEQKTEQTN